jgi:hypothetical protein
MELASKRGQQQLMLAAAVQLKHPAALAAAGCNEDSGIVILPTANCIDEMAHLIEPCPGPQGHKLCPAREAALKRGAMLMGAPAYSRQEHHQHLVSAQQSSKTHRKGQW